MKKLRDRTGLSLMQMLVAPMLLLAFALPAAAQPGLTIDRITRKSLEDLERMLRTAPPEEIDKNLNDVINSAGYIQPLARIFFQLAQSAGQVETLAQHYGAIISHWPDSAWAQKAAVEFIPVIFMSGGRTDQRIEDLIWSNQESLLAPSSDAASIGENPELLRADVFLQMTLLAHHRNLPGRVMSLAQKAGSVESLPFQDTLELAAAYAEIRAENKPEAEARLLKWLNQYPASELRALALFALYQITENAEQKNLAMAAIRQEFSDTLEGYQLKEYHVEYGAGPLKPLKAQ